MDYVICVTFSLEVGVFFLMQTFWNYLSNRVAKRSFMGSFEFKFYIVMACCSIVIFPTLQYVYRNDVNKREAIPQLAFGTEALFVSLLGIRSHIRFSRIIGISQRNGHAGNKGIVNKLSYFKDMNVVLSLCLGGFAVAMIILCIDGLTVEKVINHNKFAADFLIAFANICTLFLYQAIISVFHPRPQYLNKSDETTTSGNESNFQLSTAPKTEDGRRTAFGDHHSDSDMKSGINQSNGGFMRAMSPVHVDHPYTNDTLPLTSNAAALSNRTFSPVDNKPSYNKSHNIEVEDPYNCEPVMFTMVDIASKKQQQQQRYAIPSSPTSVSSHSSIPQNMQNRVKSPMRKYNDDDSYEMSYQSEKSSRYRQPSWDHREDARSPPTSPGSPNNAAKQPNDWLWQSPDRRNP
ncbi:hypothetical protein BDB01DRAFT_731219 [Pilobolus umbonatus]|nr:hypothetical protein BDB01DRAFT_731219 [Pilobolus umbonatus]